MDVGGKNINMKCSSIQMSNLVTKEQQIRVCKMPAEDPLRTRLWSDGGGMRQVGTNLCLKKGGPMGGVRVLQCTQC